MEVIFGVQARDGTIRAQVPDDKVDDLRKQLEKAIANDDASVVWVTDKDGREIGIPSDKIAFVEFGSEKTSRQVGFSSTN